MIKKKENLEIDIGLMSKFDVILAETKTKLKDMQYKVPWKIPDFQEVWKKG